jgi:hypothetical protein
LSASSFDGASPPSVIDEMAPHLRGHEPEEGVPRCAIDRTAAAETHERFVHEFSGLERVVGTLAAHHPAS